MCKAESNSPPYDPDPKAPDVLEFKGRFYINMNRAGFNSRTNNGFGYGTKKQALDVISGKRSRFN